MMTAVDLRSFQPHPDLLFEKVAAVVDEKMLHSIAKSDYGYLEDEHLTALRSLVSEKDFRTAFGWCPDEVLSLCSFGFRERQPYPASPDVQRERLRSLFCCAALLRSNGEPYASHSWRHESTLLACLLGSVEGLPHFREVSTRFLAWRVVATQIQVEDLPFFVFSLLVLVCWTPQFSDDESRIVQLCELLDYVELDAHTDPMAFLELYSTEPWLVGLLPYDSSRDLWCSYSADFRAAAAKCADAMARDQLLHVADRLASIEPFVLYGVRGKWQLRK